MADAYIFDDLIGAIQNSFVRANVMLQDQHVQMMSTYFDAQGKPLVVDLKLPSHNPHDSGSIDVQVPKICLVPLSSVRMKELNVKFKVEFAQLLKNTNEQTSSAIRSLFPRPHTHKKDNQYATVEIKLEGVDPPEGVLKINDYLIKFLP